MTRDEFAWVLIRFSGVVLLIFALATFTTTIPLTVSMISVTDQSFGQAMDQKSQDELHRASVRSALSNVLFLSSPGFLYLFAGLYLLLRGQFVFKAITRTDLK